MGATVEVLLSKEQDIGTTFTFESMPSKLLGEDAKVRLCRVNSYTFARATIKGRDRLFVSGSPQRIYVSAHSHQRFYFEALLKLGCITQEQFDLNERAYNEYQWGRAAKEFENDVRLCLQFAEIDLNKTQEAKLAKAVKEIASGKALPQ